MNKELCQILDWDSRFFGFRVAEVTARDAQPARLGEILDWCETNRIRCLYFLVASEAKELQTTALKSGFKAVDERLTLSMARASSTLPAQSFPEGKIRPFQSEDKPMLCKIAGQAHRGTRFFNDLEFSPASAATLYERWMAACCEGDAEEIFVATAQAAPIGYLSCHRQSAKVGRIGLFGLLPSHQGQGLGKALMARALAWFWEHNFEEVRVATQGKNENALALYRSVGFSLKSRQTWLHRWFESKEGTST